MVRIVIYCEDHYGMHFFPQLVNRLKKKGDFERYVGIKMDVLPADCNQKLTKKLKSDLIKYDVDDVIQKLCKFSSLVFR